MCAPQRGHQQSASCLLTHRSGTGHPRMKRALVRRTIYLHTRGMCTAYCIDHKAACQERQVQGGNPTPISGRPLWPIPPYVMGDLHNPKPELRKGIQVRSYTIGTCSHG